MPQLPFTKIKEAGQRIQRYRFHMEYIPGTFYTGEIDVAERLQHFYIGLSKDQVPIGEVFWEGSDGFGRKINSFTWVKLKGKPLLNLWQAVNNMLLPESTINVREELLSWVVDVQPDRFPPREDTDNWMRAAFGAQPTGKTQAIWTNIRNLARTLEVRVSIAVSRRSNLIELLSVHTQSQDMSSDYKLTFEPLEEAIPRLPTDARNSIVPNLSIMPESLIFDTPNIGGWGFATEHGPWAQRAIKLIEEKEKTIPAEQRIYEEIYHKDLGQTPFPPPDGIVPSDRLAIAELNPDLVNQPFHPIILGTNYEDSTGLPPAGAAPGTSPTRALPSFYDQWFAGNPQFINLCSKPPYYRYYHHFGGDNDGLEYSDWFWFNSAPPTTCTNSSGKGSYYSARDWGFGPPRVDETLNLMTFKRAMEQYHQYSWRGKLNAYLMLGHVIHLLQDQSEPDHAKLVAHPGSGSNEAEAKDECKYCEFVAAQAAIAAAIACWGIFSWICGPAAFGIAYGACKAAADTTQVGYERLVMDCWRLSRVENRILQTGVVSKDNYDDYFHAMSEFAKGAVEQCKLLYPNANLESALGCSELTIAVGVSPPGLDPDIDVDDPVQKQPYMELTDILAPQTIGLCAGLIEHFFDIVNYPPFIERVEIVQWDELGRPREFAKLSNGDTHCLRYDVEWQQQQNKRSKVVHNQQKLSPGRFSYIFALFGPTGIGPNKGHGRVMDEVKLHVKSPNWMGHTLDLEVEMKPEEDVQFGTYYWGCFQLNNCGNDPQTVTLEFSGKDRGAHYKTRNYAGDVIDAKPDTLARVDINSQAFDWLDYSPGVDTNHQITFAPLEWRLVIPPSPLVLGRDSNSRTVKLEIQQKMWSCNWEPIWGAVSCPVQWELAEQVVRKTRFSQTQGTAADFGLRVIFEAVNGVATLTVTLPESLRIHTSVKVVPATYVFEIRYTIGFPPKQHSVKVEVKVTK